LVDYLEDRLRSGQSGIDTARQRSDVVAEHLVRAVHNDRDGRQDERVLRHRLGAMQAHKTLTNLQKSLSKDVHFSLLLDLFHFDEADFWFSLYYRLIYQTRFQIRYRLHDILAADNKLAQFFKRSLVSSRFARWFNYVVLVSTRRATIGLNLKSRVYLSSSEHTIEKAANVSARAQQNPLGRNEPNGNKSLVNLEKRPTCALT